MNKKNSTPLVSIIIPVYNMSKYIVDTLDSIKSQTFTDFEVLIVDDASSDDSEDIIRRYQLEDTRFKLLKNTHTKGASGARNTGIDSAAGEWLAFLDADDLWPADSLELRLNAHEMYPECQYIGGDYARFTHDLSQPEATMVAANEVWNDFFSESIKTGDMLCLQEPIKYFLKSVLVNTGTVFVKSSIVKEIGGFDESLQIVEDHLLWMNIAVNVNLFVFVPKVLMYYRQRENSLTHTERSKYHDAVRAYDILRKKPEFKKYHRELSDNICHFIKLNSFFYRNNKNYWEALKWSIKSVLCSPGSMTSWKNLISSCFLR